MDIIFNPLFILFFHSIVQTLVTYLLRTDLHILYIIFHSMSLDTRMTALFEQSINLNTRCFACGSLVYAVEKKLTTNHVNILVF
jgi:hypothetical protein